MNKILRTAIVVLSIPLLTLGLKTLLAPLSMAQIVGMEPSGLTGLNSLRSMFPGVLMGSAFMMLAGLRTKDTTWFRAAALLMGVVAFGRVLSFALDGFDAASVQPTVIELVILLVLVAADMRFTGERPAESTG